MPTPAAVPALLPLSLLEAIRNLDTPVEDGLDELAEEIVVRRLGLSPTVAAQIQRYRAAAEKDATVDIDEVVSVLRLVGRRPDATLVFADAGRRAARYAARSRGRSARTLARVSPERLARRVSLRAVARLAADNQRACDVSLEQVMGCGMGGCYSCVVLTRETGHAPHFVRSCIDGPVFDSSRIVWEALSH